MSEYGKPGKCSELEALCKRVFFAAHLDGWIGNQTRRDVQMVDAAKSWSAFVKNGALAKSIDDLVLARSDDLPVFPCANLRAALESALCAPAWSEALGCVHDAIDALATPATSA